jgi:hypothetical protein
VKRRRWLLTAIMIDTAESTKELLPTAEVNDLIREQLGQLKRIGIRTQSYNVVFVDTLTEDSKI